MKLTIPCIITMLVCMALNSCRENEILNEYSTDTSMGVSSGTFKRGSDSLIVTDTLTGIKDDTKDPPKTGSHWRP